MVEVGDNIKIYEAMYHKNRYKAAGTATVLSKNNKFILIDYGNYRGTLNIFDLQKGNIKLVKQETKDNDGGQEMTKPDVNELITIAKDCTTRKEFIQKTSVKYDKVSADTIEGWYYRFKLGKYAKNQDTAQEQTMDSEKIKVETTSSGEFTNIEAPEAPQPQQPQYMLRPNTLESVNSNFKYQLQPECVDMMYLSGSITIDWKDVETMIGELKELLQYRHLYK